MNGLDQRRFMKSIREAFEFKTFRMMFAVIFLAFILALALGYTYFFRHQVFMSSQSLPPVLENAGVVGQVLLLVLALIAILIGWITVVISLRILGSLKRLERDLTRMARGEIPESIKFRTRDEMEFHMISLPFNELVERMQHERSELVWLQERCRDIRIQAEGKALSPEEVVVQLKAQEERLAELLKT